MSRIPTQSIRTNEHRLIPVQSTEKESGRHLFGVDGTSNNKIIVDPKQKKKLRKKNTFLQLTSKSS